MKFIIDKNSVINFMLKFIGDIIILLGLYLSAASLGFLQKIPLIFDHFHADNTSTQLISLMLIFIGVEVGVKFKHFNNKDKEKVEE